MRDKEVPYGFWLTNLPIYKGVTDPNHYVDQVTDLLSIVGLRQDQMCRLFHMKLEGLALLKYRGLKQHSIASYSELTEKFTQHFRGSCELARDPKKLKQLRQSQ